MKKTRKFKNKELFLKWFKKSQKNKYSIKHGGEEPKGNGKKGDSSSSPKLVGESVVTKKKAFALAAVVTLGQVAYSLASNPMVVSAIVGLGVGTTAFTGVATAGASVVFLAVGTYAYFKITAAYSNYYTMLHVMNDFILLLQKIDIMVRVAIKISQQYQFVIDTKDVNKCLERIFSRFDKLLSIKDITDIKKNVENPKIRIEDKLNEAANNAQEQLDENASEVGKVTQEDPADIEVKVSFMDKFKQFFKILKFNSKKFTSQLNEEVIRLGLYFSILLGEFNIILNVSQMTIIEKRDFKLLLTNNTGVKSSDDFKKLLISSIIYRTLQIYNIFELCTPGASISDAAKKTTCSKEMIDQYIDEIETERVKIRKVLFGKSNTTKQFLFPLYQDRSGNSSELNILRGIMRGFNNSITEEKEARDFCKKIHDFNEKYSSATKEKRSDTSTGSTISTDNLGEDYYEDTGEAPPLQKPPLPTRGYTNSPIGQETIVK